MDLLVLKFFRIGICRRCGAELGNSLLCLRQQRLPLRRRDIINNAGRNPALRRILKREFLEVLQQFYSRPRAEFGIVETGLNDCRELPPTGFIVEKRELLSGVRVHPLQFGWKHFVKNHSADGSENRFARRAVFGEKQLDAVVQLELPGTVRGDDFLRMHVAAVIPRLPANLIK